MFLIFHAEASIVFKFWSKMSNELLSKMYFIEI